MVFICYCWCPFLCYSLPYVGVVLYLAMWVCIVNLYPVSIHFALTIYPLTFFIPLITNSLSSVHPLPTPHFTPPFNNATSSSHHLSTYFLLHPTLYLSLSSSLFLLTILILSPFTNSLYDIYLTFAYLHLFLLLFLSL